MGEGYYHKIIIKALEISTTNSNNYWVPAYKEDKWRDNTIKPTDKVIIRITNSSHKADVTSDVRGILTMTLLLKSITITINPTNKELVVINNRNNYKR